MRRTFAILIVGVAFLSLGIGPAAEDQPQSSQASIPPLVGMTLPEYDSEGNLLRPVGFEKWVVVGTSIGLSYSDGEKKDPNNPGMFHNVYMQPQAFDHFVRTGEFADQTVFVVTNNPSQATKGKDELNRQGFFASPSTGLEVAVKDSKRFEDVWAYYMFHDKPETKKLGGQRDSEKAFPRTDCHECHLEHGRDDNVFTQFYSVLTSARERHLAGSAAAK